MYKVQQNAEGKLRLVEEGGATTRLLATLAQLQSDTEWRERIEFRPSLYEEGVKYAILMPSAYEDIEV